MVKTLKTGVIGYPIDHSLSPAIHEFWLKEYGIPAVYEALEVTPEQLEIFLNQTVFQEEYTGLNVTIPHKEEVLKYVRYADEAVDFIGAANTLQIDLKEKAIYARNTDIYGFTTHLKKSAPDANFKGKKAVVLGAGGAARAVCAGILGDEIQAWDLIITNRTKKRAIALKKHLSDRIRKMLSTEKSLEFSEVTEGMNAFIDRIQIVDWEERESALNNAALLVNTTSLGMQGQPKLDVSLEKLPKDAVVMDIVYKPLMTNLLEEAEKRGNIAVDGLGMLLHQAAPAFALWFQRTPEVTKELENHIKSFL